MDLHLNAFLRATLNRIPLNDSLKRFLRPGAQAALAACSPVAPQLRLAAQAALAARAGYIMRPDAQAALAV